MIGGRTQGKHCKSMLPNTIAIVKLENRWIAICGYFKPLKSG